MEKTYQCTNQSNQCCKTTFHFFSESTKSAGAFLAAVGATSAVAGFSKAIMSAKKSDPKYFDKGLHGSLALHEAGTSLALRALGWGTLYAILGTGTICFGIWKLSGAKNVSKVGEGKLPCWSYTSGRSVIGQPFDFEVSVRPKKKKMRN